MTENKNKVSPGDIVRAVNFDGNYVYGIVLEISVPDWRFATVHWAGGGRGTIFVTALENVSEAW